jgi:hypothetical protein
MATARAECITEPKGERTNSGNLCHANWKQYHAGWLRGVSRILEGEPLGRRGSGRAISCWLR